MAEDKEQIVNLESRMEVNRSKEEHKFADNLIIINRQWLERLMENLNG